MNAEMNPHASPVFNAVSGLAESIVQTVVFGAFAHYMYAKGHPVEAAALAGLTFLMGMGAIQHLRKMRGMFARSTVSLRPS
ncbi:MAG: hypothetical protein H6865_04960 [Rhodospirillales bacterium]|nr:hypothetical protein [Alphaproteobacteria bacterium]MCB9986968.1 hypothetical protein [Rhodospirillales bacterium]USO08257.1 MAG: hypothetical protein H6866_03330 [Rhodospirillales bacterium]